MGSFMRATAVSPAPRDAETADRDGILVARCLDGDQTAWQELIDRYSRLVEAVIRRYHLPSEEQADVFQDVWVALWRDLGSLRSHQRLGPWLVTATGRMAWDARKRLPRHLDGGPVDLLSDVLEDQAATPEQEVTRRETSERLRAALARVSPRCRLLLQALFFDETVSYTTIATQLGCSPNSIGPIRSRCFKELRDALGEP
ncbi:MAG: sigma-70 family RNA polymerase sigma factor [Chloroflexota bacterium]